MEKIIDNIHIKRIGYFNLYVIRGTTGDILIDTGFICMKKRIKKWLDKFNIKLIILTHAHVDHIWNVAYIKELYNCEVAISKKDIKNIDNSNINSKPSKNIFKIWTKIMNWGMKHFVAKPFEIDYLLTDKQKINKYGISLQIHNLKGHTNGSIGIKYKDYLFVGDAIVNRFKVSAAYQNQDLKSSKKSIQKILSLQPTITFLGHDQEVYYDKLKRDLSENKKYLKFSFGFHNSSIK